MIAWWRIWRAAKLLRHPVRLYRALRLVDHAPQACKLILLEAGWCSARVLQSSTMVPPVVWTLWEFDSDKHRACTKYYCVSLKQAWTAHVLDNFTPEDFA